jgi:hypothetical protein
MEVNLKLDQFSQQLTNVAQQAYPESGKLKSSIKVEVTEDDIIISFLNYGLFQDAGVQGAFGTKHPSGQGFNKEVFKYKPITKVFKTKGKNKDKKQGKARPVPVGGDLSFGARVNIRKFGIPAKPWIARMITNISDQAGKDIEITLPPQIEAEIVKLLGSIK